MCDKHVALRKYILTCTGKWYDFFSLYIFCYSDE